MTSADNERLTRTGRWAPHFPTPGATAEFLSLQRSHDQAVRERGAAEKPMNWADIAGWADEGTWLRILADHRDSQPETFAQLVALRPARTGGGVDA